MTGTNTSRMVGASSAGNVPTRDRIVQAAIELFAHGGYAGTSVLRIADRVGISDAGVFYHFPTKRDLFVAVVDVFVAAQADDFADLIEPGGLAAIGNLRGWGAVMERRPDLLALQVVLTAEAITPDADLHDYWAGRHVGLLGLLAALFRQAIDRGEIRVDVDPDYEASALAAHLDGIRLQWFYSNRQISIARSFETYISELIDRISIRRA
jgi:AcrR family transcriptional regulator